jgi:hypothetical protein
LSDQALLAMAMAADAASTSVRTPAPLWDRPGFWLALWLGSAALFLAWRLVSYFRMRRDLLTGARPVGEVGQIRLVETPAVSSPVAFGVRDKVVALPPLFMAMENRVARDLAIAHELAHHLGHDIAANFAAQPLLALHWFNPLAWMGWRAMRRDQEAACDARVLAGRDRHERALYAGLIANFAAGPRLALAAPMACPIIGEKSIIHRLRSLSMSDVSPARRRLGRWLLAGGALMLPLTASISYAAAAQDRTVESVDVVASAVPSAPRAPEAPEAPQAPEAPHAPEAPRIERHVIQMKRGGDGTDKRERRMVVVRGDGPMSEAQRKHYEQMAREWEKQGAEWEKKSAEWEKIGKEHRAMALAMAERMPQVSTDCDKAGGSSSRSWTDDSGRQHIVICERVIRQQARMAQDQASMRLRMARDTIAHNEAIGASVRDQVLAELDQEIVRLEVQK